ncbi:hypothetical protein HCN44_005945 [Aphidius gifuensis]|uniref:Uncharacterized protein n=1 Tax=Aphidius gifuensis TaxID=684658 RepID=A0A835CWB9_APHGI|nr:hypothetical protein HCN44_005945 [Aphidius gifuensis]
MPNNIFKKSHSVKHSSAAESHNRQIWCYECDNDVPADSRKPLLETVEFIEKLATTSYTPSQPVLKKDNTPPVVILDRNWVLSDTEPVGSIVTRVHAHDAEQNDLIYGLEPLGHKYNGDDSPQLLLPFTIDNKTGTIFFSETLKGRVNKSYNFDIYLFICLEEKFYFYGLLYQMVNWQLKQKYISPFSSQHGSGGRIRPSILSLPAISNYPRPPQIPPSSILNDNIDEPTNTTSRKKIKKR